MRRISSFARLWLHWATSSYHVTSSELDVSVFVHHVYLVRPLPVGPGEVHPVLLLLNPVKAGLPPPRGHPPS